ncbi:MAG: VWA domain-containing protein [Cyclobacteriaceae bacterium]|nr:VWA domain-containing protein [Cyclobacteriaceae bacterium]MCO5270866.1 VWA domain-containing protein [Cyclobacteriaceae bacterium]
MNFAFPQFLWALTALSIPIIVHLFNFRKTTRVFFSNNRLLRQIKEETTQKRRLKQYLVLASRLLFVFFLVMAFAQPFLPAKEQVSAARNIVIYLDNSYSMSAQVGGKARALDAGIGFVREIVDLFPPDTRYKLVTNDFAPFSNAFKTQTEILDLLTQVRLSAVSRTWDEVDKRIGTEKEGADIFWISDFQKSTSGTGEGIQADSSSQWHLVPVAFGQASNIYVDTVYLENPFAIGGEKNTVNIGLRNMGSKRTDGLNVKLVVNGVQTGAVSVDLAPNSYAETSFDLATGTRGLNAAKISFTDFPISFDNEFYFALNFTETIKVVEVKDNKEDDFVARVFGNRQLFGFKSYMAGNVDYSSLAQADLIVLNGLDDIDAPLLATIATDMDNLGALLIVPGERPNLNAYKQLAPLPNLSLAPTAEMTKLDQPDFKDPFFENVFEGQSSAMEMPGAIPLLDWGMDRSAILRFRTGKPFLSQAGKVFVMSSPLQRNYTNFYNHALFVPVMYRIAATSRRAAQDLYYTLGHDLITLRADSVYGEVPIRLVGPGEIVPSQRRVGDRFFLEMPKFSIDPGFYNVLYQKDTLGLLAVNLEKKESDLAQYGPDEIRQRFGGGGHVTMFQSNSPESFGNEIKERYLGTPLWKYALLLALLFLLAEVLFIRFLK